MPQINLGRVGFVNKGAYIGGTTAYKINDVVKYNNSVYVCLQAHSTEQLPTVAAYWDVWVNNPGSNIIHTVGSGLPNEGYTKVEADATLAQMQGNNAQRFKVADAINANEAVSKNQLDLKATLAEAQAYDLGVGQTWQDVTASRSAGVTYTNTTGKPIEVSMACHSITNEDLYLFIDGLLVQKLNIYNTSGFVSAVVPNNSTYRLSKGSTGGLLGLTWFELR